MKADSAGVERRGLERLHQTEQIDGRRDHDRVDLEEGRVVRILFSLIMRPCVGHGEINELETLPILSLLNLSLRAFDDACDGFDVRIERQGMGGEEGEQREGGEGCFHGV